MKARKKILILFITCLVILIGAVIIDKIYYKDYFIELDYNQFVKKIEKKESFVLCLSQTTCTHCASYKPKLKEVAKSYKTEIYYIETNLLSQEKLEEFKKIINFTSTPTTVFIKDGEEKTVATRISGDVEKSKIIIKLKSNGIIK